MQYNFDEVIDRRNTESEKWRHYESDVLPLWVADMDFRSPEPVIAALQQRVAHGVFGYPSGLDATGHKQPPLKQAILEYLERRYAWEVSPETLVLVPGVVTGLNLAAHAFAKPEGGVLVQTPVYPPFLYIARQAGILHQEMQLALQPDGRYEVDWEAFERSITPQTRMFVLCNPHNPVGRVFTRVELERMAEICLRHDLVIISDEIHCDLVYAPNQHIPIASLDPEIARRTVTLMAPSKTFNIAGLECSFAIIPDAQTRKRYLDGRQGLVGWVNLMGQVAAEAAYREGQEWLNQLLVYLEDNRNWLAGYVRDHFPGVKMASPEGTYLAWLDFRALELPGGPYQHFLEKAKVALNDGKMFGTGGEGFVRLNFGCPRAVLVEAVERMRRSI
jgi:cystathionine beta-lyase